VASRSSTFESDVLRLLTPLLKARYIFLAVAAALFALQHISGTGKDWQYLVEGGELLFGQHHRYTPLAGGLHLYANYPTIQIGPLSLLLAAPIRLIGSDEGRVAGAVLMTAVAPALVYALERTARILRPAVDERLLQLTVLLGGLMVVQSWATLAAIYAHLDDVLVLAAGIGALWAVATGRSVLLGVCIGVAIAAKPWGVVVLPLALALRGRSRWIALSWGSGIAALAWAPFVLGDTRTLDAIKPPIVVSPDSVLHLFGVAATDAPSWIRPVQLGCVLLVGVFAVTRGRWAAALLVGITARLALDPQVFLYYTAGLVLAAFAWDMLRSRRPLPLWTLFAFVLLNDSYVLIDDSSVQSAIRLVLSIVLMGVVLFGPFERQEDTTSSEVSGTKLGERALESR
jgi:hypothetical protein